MTPDTIIDLTHTLNCEAPTWEGSCGFHISLKLDYPECTGPLPFRVQELKFHAGVGTHIDAPCHCFPGSADISSLSLENLIAPFIKIDIEAKASEDYALSKEDVLEFEKRYGVIEKGSIAVIHTGWQRFWNQKDKYRNSLKFPHVSKQAAQTLLEREVCGIAIDTLSPDSNHPEFPVHQLFLGSGKYIIENMAHSDLLPAKGRWLMALPLKGEGLSEAPIRLIAHLKKE